MAIDLQWLGFISQNDEGSDDTTADGLQVAWVTFADSNYDGQGPTDITLAPGVLKQFKNGALIDITTQSTANGGTFGAAWKQFAQDYKAIFPNRTIVLVNSARGGSSLGPNSNGPYDWYTTGGVMRAKADSEINACLSYLGLSKPKFIFSNAVINDIRNGTTFANIQTYFDSALSYLHGKFPTVPVWYSLPGHDGNGNLNSLIQRQCRDMIVQKQRTDAMFAVDSSCMLWTALGQGSLHASDQAAYNQLGACKARMVANEYNSAGNLTNKWARTIISQHYGTLTSTQKDLIEAEMIGLGNAVFTDLEYLYHFKTADTRDQYIDYCGITAPQSLLTSFTANSHVSTTGANGSYWLTNFVPSTLPLRSSQNDMFHGAWVKQFFSDATTLRGLIGSQNAAAQFVVGHTTTGVFYRVNDLTLTIGRTGVIANNTFTVGLRKAASGTDAAELWENGVRTHSSTKASTGIPNQVVIGGGSNNGGANSSPSQVDLQILVGGKATGITQATLYSIFNTRETAWT